MRAAEVMQIAVIGAVLVGGGIVAVSKFSGPGESEPTVRVEIPELSPKAARGEQAFNANCASCHGKNAAGTDAGPPLVHDVYNPGHHDDGAFYRAVENGVRRHHWNYGNMPPQPQVSRETVATIVRYVRELQRANGIRYREHRM